ncbi:MAG: addiction module toxin RelE [Acidobacteria bacterium]|nr:addiction module toxin RelE [Acidobacteriota bacterium]
MRAKLIHFVESPGFTNRIDKLASLEVLLSLQNDLIRDPELGDLMAGCAGARKGRVGDKAAGKGKSGGFRYIYVYIVIAGTIYLIHFYGKNEKGNLSKAERNELAKLVKELKRLYGEEN